MVADCNLVFQKSIFVFDKLLFVLRKAIYFFNSYHDYDDYKWHAVLNSSSNNGAGKQSGVKREIVAKKNCGAKGELPV